MAYNASMTRIKVVRPYDRGIDEALERGYATIPALPDGFYLAKKRQELEDAMVVERMKQNEFRITRTEDVLTKIFEGERYSLYEKKLKKWHELV